MVLFWVLWIIDLLVALVTLYFFFIGLMDGSVSSFNGGLWTLILIFLVVILGGSLFLKAAGYLKIAKALLWILAIPALFYALFLLVVIFSGAKWN